MSAGDVAHATLGMSFAIRSQRVAFAMKERYLSAGVVRAALAVDVGHAILTMLVAIRPYRAALDTGTRLYLATTMYASAAADIHLTIRNMRLEIRRLLALGTKAPPRLASLFRRAAALNTDPRMPCAGGERATHFKDAHDSVLRYSL